LTPCDAKIVFKVPHAYNGVIGMMYAGLGAYVVVLYYMVARLYANA
jgi:hypothetical protein